FAITRCGLQKASLRWRQVANGQLFFLVRNVGPKKSHGRTGESSHRRIVAQ
ncbi:MAG: hypothetical protein ACJA0X_001622, partial [Cyclobacteriaceae bacterium]